MPTYHLAVVVDDYLMKISHAFRGEEWLPSAPVHVLLWNYLGWTNEMPQWAHLPLILKPDGNGKLSKRDGDRLGFPVFAMNWEDPNTHELIHGFRELGFLPEAFINLLALLGWADGTEQEIFTIEELIESFSIDRVHKGGAKFNYEKAKWFNHEWIKRMGAGRLKNDVARIFKDAGITVTDDALFEKIICMVKDRCTLLTDFKEQAGFFYNAPSSYDTVALKGKWDSGKVSFFTSFVVSLKEVTWESLVIEENFKRLATEISIKPGELLLPLRIMLVGAKFGPPVFEIAGILGREETILRIENAITAFGELSS
jgi:glutamyl-tRNA synthetase